MKYDYQKFLAAVMRKIEGLNPSAGFLLGIVLVNKAVEAGWFQQYEENESLCNDMTVEEMALRILAQQDEIEPYP